MQSSMAEIKELLKHYHFYKGQIENGIAAKVLEEKIHFLETSINLLEEKCYELLMKVFIDNTGIKKIAKQMNCSRQNIYKKISAILTPIALSYDIKFKRVDKRLTQS